MEHACDSLFSFSVIISGFILLIFVFFKGWNTHQGLVYCWNLFAIDYTYIAVGDIATFSALYTTGTTETNNKVSVNIF